MKAITLVTLIFICNISFAQLQKQKSNTLSGDITINIDVTTLEDTAGVFRVQLGGQTLLPTIKNNRLTIKQHLDEPQAAYLYFHPRDTVNKYSDRALDELPFEAKNVYFFFAQPGIYNALTARQLNKTFIKNPTAYQQAYSHLFKQSIDLMTEFRTKNSTLKIELRSAKGKQKDSLLNLFINKQNRELRKFRDSVAFPFVKQNPDSPVALQQLSEYLSSDSVDYRAMLALYNGFTARIKALPSAQTAQYVIHNKLGYKNVLLNKPAPDFVLKDTAGKTISLKNFRGRVVLLDFWASWCVPCRANNPSLVRIYNKFKTKGFEIISISLDNNKNSWKKAINADGLTWTHVSELKQWYGKINKIYRVTAVPMYYLIGKDGMVLAVNLAEQELDKQLTSLLL